MKGSRNWFKRQKRKASYGYKVATLGGGSRKRYRGAMRRGKRLF